MAELLPDDFQHTSTGIWSAGTSPAICIGGMPTREAVRRVNRMVAGLPELIAQAARFAVCFAMPTLGYDPELEWKLVAAGVDALPAEHAQQCYVVLGRNDAPHRQWVVVFEEHARRWKPVSLQPLPRLDR